MKKYIKSEYIMAMATEKSRLIKRMDSWSDNIMQHLSKCAMYSDSLPGEKYDHWIEELSTWIHDINITVCKPNNKKLKPVQYESCLFGWLSKDTPEASSNLHDLQSKNSEYKDKSYPYIEVDSDMIERMRKISEGVLETFVPLLSSKNSATKEDIKRSLHAIIDPVCLNT